MIETFCFLPFKAEIHSFPAAKLYINSSLAQQYLYTFRAVENNRLA
jgi:hypothetical protein